MKLFSVLVFVGFALNVQAQAESNLPLNAPTSAVSDADLREEVKGSITPSSTEQEKQLLENKEVQDGKKHQASEATKKKKKKKDKKKLKQ